MKLKNSSRFLKKFFLGCGAILLTFVGACCGKKKCSNNQCNNSSQLNADCKNSDCPVCPTCPTGGLSNCTVLDSTSGANNCIAPSGLSGAICTAVAQITSFPKPPLATHLIIGMPIITTTGDVVSTVLNTQTQSAVSISVNDVLAISASASVQLTGGPGGGTVNISITASWLQCL